MPEPSNDPIKSNDPKYATGPEARKVANVPFSGDVVTVEDQFKNNAQVLKRVAKIPAGNKLERSEPRKTRW